MLLALTSWRVCAQTHPQCLNSILFKVLVMEWYKISKSCYLVHKCHCTEELVRQGYRFLLKGQCKEIRIAQSCSVAFSSLVKSFITILSCVAAGEAANSGSGHLCDRDLWKCTCSLCEKSHSGQKEGFQLYSQTVA